MNAGGKGIGGNDSFMQSTSRMDADEGGPFSITIPSAFMRTTQGLDEARDTTFSKKIKKEGIDLPGVSEHLPCSIEAVDHLHEIFIEGKNKLDQEVRHA
jgi:hypothetical protein